MLLEYAKRAPEDGRSLFQASIFSIGVLIAALAAVSCGFEALGHIDRLPVHGGLLLFGAVCALFSVSSVCRRPARFRRAIMWISIALVSDLTVIILSTEPLVGLCAVSIGDLPDSIHGWNYHAPLEWVKEASELRTAACVCGLLNVALVRLIAAKIGRDAETAVSRSSGRA